MNGEENALTPWPVQVAWHKYQQLMLTGVPAPIRNEARLAFFAGVSSIYELFLATIEGTEDAEQLERVKAEMLAWVTGVFDPEFARRHQPRSPGLLM